jgi:hypothetical protein
VAVSGATESADQAEEGADLVDERRRLFQRGEVSAPSEARDRLRLLIVRSVAANLLDAVDEPRRLRAVDGGPGGGSIMVLHPRCISAALEEGP